MGKHLAVPVLSKLEGATVGAITAMYGMVLVLLYPRRGHHHAMLRLATEPFACHQMVLSAEIPEVIVKFFADN